MVYALDTNTIIRFLHNDTNVCHKFNNAVMVGYKIVVPKMTDYEIRRGFHIKPNPRKEVYYKTLLEDCAIMEIDADTLDYAIPIYEGHYHNRHTADEMDILIAALCIQNDYTLVTNNAKDYKGVGGLKWVDWTQAEA